MNSSADTPNLSSDLKSQLGKQLKINDDYEEYSFIALYCYLDKVLKGKAEERVVYDVYISQRKPSPPTITTKVQVNTV